MPVTRLLAAAWAALLPLAALAQAPRAAPASCPSRPAECQLSTPVYNFGRQEMTLTSAPIYGEGSVSVTCTRAPGQGFSMSIDYELKAVPSAPNRVMRDRELALLLYDLFVDTGRVQYWGDGTGGTKTFTGKMDLNDINRSITRTHQIYGTVQGQQRVEPGQWLGFVSARLEYTIKKCR